MGPISSLLVKQYVDIRTDILTDIRTYGWTYGQSYGPIDRKMLITWSLKQVSVKKILLWGAASVLNSQIQFAKLPRRNSVRHLGMKYSRIATELEQLISFFSENVNFWTVLQ
jgi:hypothetical protein